MSAHRSLPTLVIFTLLAAPSSAAVLVVDCSQPLPLPPPPYTDITSASLAATPGDTILVVGGPCPSATIFQKTDLTLLAAKVGTDIGSGPAGVGNPIIGSIQISGPAGSSDCLRIHDSHGIYIHGFELTQCQTAVHLSISSGVRAHRNVIGSNDTGIWIDGSFNVEMTGNLFIRALFSGGGPGVGAVNGSYGLVLEDNEITGFFMGIYFASGVRDFLIANNMVHANDQSGIQLDGQNPGFVLRNTVLNNWTGGGAGDDINVDFPIGSPVCVVGNDTCPVASCSALPNSITSGLSCVSQNR